MYKDHPKLFTKYAAGLLIALISAGCMVAQAAPTASIIPTLAANIGGQRFESDEADMTYIVAMGGFTISAETKGASTDPSPSLKSDLVVVSCGKWADTPRKYGPEDFASGLCSASLEKARSRDSRVKPEGEYEVKPKMPGKSLIEFTKVMGKLVEGRFELELIDAKGFKINITSGTFRLRDARL